MLHLLGSPVLGMGEGWGRDIIHCTLIMGGGWGRVFHLLVSPGRGGEGCFIC